MYQFTLERGSRKHVCPDCGQKTFVRVIDADTGHYLADNAGRCDRESKCGYQYTAKQYFANNPDFRKDSGYQVWPRNKGYQRQGPNAENVLQGRYSQRILQPAADYLELTHLLETIGDYDRNSFTQFLTRLFPFDPESVQAAIADYKIGTFRGWTSFPVIDRQGRFCKAKLMRFDPETGKRLKDIHGRGLSFTLQRSVS